ncbi:hypothetical protein QYF61_005946 [Mycteria americana]|uniref:Uncharacterized protein n=1 Tax=Mycteria americana TaxID=33587 RepID=A0AAN7SIL5_MYCAM|nr:hypothetical protein QYF61_005946 [Mycteria americana]
MDGQNRGAPAARTTGGFKPPEVPPTAACMADLVPLPLDTAKAGLQGEAKLTGQGPAAQYKGLRHHGEDGGTPLQRQRGFASTRVGLCDSAKLLYTKGKSVGAAGQPLHGQHLGSVPLGVQLCDGALQHNLPCRFTSAFGDGFCATLVAFPVDVVKMRYLNGAPGQHSSVRSCAFALLRSEGAEAFYKGFAGVRYRLPSSSKTQ